MLTGINMKNVASQLQEQTRWLEECVGNVEQFLAKQDWRFINGVWLMTPTPIKADDGETIFPNIMWSQTAGLKRRDGYVRVKNVELLGNGIKFEFIGGRRIEHRVQKDGTIYCEDTY